MRELHFYLCRAMLRPARASFTASLRCLSAAALLATSAQGQSPGVSAGGTVCFVANATVNGGGNAAWTTPWIWSVIEFNSSGNFVFPFDHGMFPTYSIYWDGALLKTCTQSSPSAFVSKNGASQRLPSDIPVGSGLTSCQN